MSSKYKCLRPRVVRNSCGNLVTVSCGKCSACRTMRSSRNGKLITLESLNWKYVEYFTLSYDPEHLPVCSARVYGSSVYFINETPRLDLSLENNVVACVPTHIFTPSVATDIFNKIYDEHHKKPFQYGEGFIPYSSKYDSQCFMKRFRRYLDYHNITKDVNNEKIKYFIASEYGPEHYRPHFHGLIFHNSDNLRRRFHHIIHKVWPYGNIDCSLSQGYTAGYVASYCASVVDMPDLYDCKGFRPFALHSNFLGQNELHAQVKEIYEGTRKSEPISTTVRYGDDFRKVFAPISLQNKILPRAFHSCLTDDYGNYCLLSIYRRLCQFFNLSDTSAAAAAAAYQYCDHPFKGDLEALFPQDTLEDSSYLTIFTISKNYDEISRKYPCVPLRRRISSYFRELDYKKLCSMYQSQAEHVNKFGTFNNFYLSLYYDNCPVPSLSSDGRPRYLKPYNSSDYRLSANFFGNMGFDTGKLRSEDYPIQSDADYFQQKSFCDRIFREKTKMKYLNDRIKNVF